MSFLDRNSQEGHHTVQFTMAMWAACGYLVLMSIISGFLSGCGGPSSIGLAVAGSIVVDIGLFVFLYTRIHLARSQLQKWVGGIMLAVALYCIASILTASVWVLHSQPQSIGDAIQEFELALLGLQCG